MYISSILIYLLVLLLNQGCIQSEQVENRPVSISKIKLNQDIQVSCKRERLYKQHIVINNVEPFFEEEDSIRMGQTITLSSDKLLASVDFFLKLSHQYISVAVLLYPYDGGDPDVSGGHLAESIHSGDVESAIVAGWKNFRFKRPVELQAGTYYFDIITDAIEEKDENVFVYSNGLAGYEYYSAGRRFKENKEGVWSQHSSDLAFRLYDCVE